MSSSPRLDLRTGFTEPVVLLISRRQVVECDVDSILRELKVFMATREDAWRYRGQVSITIDGYNDDPRALVDIPEVRTLMRALYRGWPYWAYFLNQVDDSIKILGSCVFGAAFPGAGAVLVDPDKLGNFLTMGFAGMNTVFERYNFPEHELEKMSQGLSEVLGME